MRGEWVGIEESGAVPDGLDDAGIAITGRAAGRGAVHAVPGDGQSPETAVAPSEPSAESWHLLPLSARTGAALERMTDRLADCLRDRPALDLADVAYTLQTERCELDERRIAICRSADEAVAILSARDPARSFSGTRREPTKFALMFSGLGSQYPSMGRGLYDAVPAYRATVDRCAELLVPMLGVDLRSIVTRPSEASSLAPGAGGVSFRAMFGRQQCTEEGDPFGRTAVAHCATFVVEYALAQLWLDWGIVPDALIGHSIGEYVAACVSGVFTLEDALSAVVERATIADEHAVGAMLAVSAGVETLEPLLFGSLSVAALNSPFLTVVSGDEGDVAALEAQLSNAGIAARRLPASQPFHSPLLAPAAERLMRHIGRLRVAAARIPMISAVTGSWLSAEATGEAAHWGAHLCRPVRFIDAIRTVAATNDRWVLLEVGPGQTLSGFARQSWPTERESDVVTLASLRFAYERQSDLGFLMATAGKSWLAGAPLRWDAMRGGAPRRRVSLPADPFDHAPD